MMRKSFFVGLILAAAVLVGATTANAAAPPGTVQFCEWTNLVDNEDGVITVLGQHTLTYPTDSSEADFYNWLINEHGGRAWSSAGEVEDTLWEIYDDNSNDIVYDEPIDDDEEVEDGDDFDFPAAFWTVSRGDCPVAPQQPDRYVYCAAAGNTDVNGNPLGVGQTVNLAWGEPNANRHFTGATLGFWVGTMGLTCQLTPEQAALAAASTVKVNHTGAPNTQEGAMVYTYIPA